MVTKRAKLWLGRGVTIAVVVAALVLALATWLQSGTIASDWLDAGPVDQGSAVVVAINESEITVRGDDPDRPGEWGLVMDDGRVRLGAVLSESGGAVRRMMLDEVGTVAPGAEGRFDAAVWGSDADLAQFGLVESAIAGPDGDLQAWVGAGDDDTWVVFVHGRGFDRAQALRSVPAVLHAGFPVLVLGYGSDDVAEAARHGYGSDEWRLLDAAVDHTLASGGRDIVVMGFGSGGSIAGTFLYESRLATRVAGVVLDAPILDLSGAVDVSWEPSGIPGFVASWAKAVAAFRYGIDWAALDHVAQAEEWIPPVLILHGRDDDSSPLQISEEFALARPDSVLLLTFPGAGPNASWNSNPARYEAALKRFLTDVAAGPSDLEPVDG